MEIKYSKIFLTYTLGGKYLVSPGIYKEAIVVNGSKTKTYDCGIVGKEVITKRPMQVVKEPSYKEATQTIELGSEFIKRALEKPKPPKKGYQRWLRQPEGKLFQEWKTIKDDETKIKRAVAIYVADLTGDPEASFRHEPV
ncbi:MAG: hypothetical protein GY775_16865 [Candidatus Scalindua sp.]|nr:hypothetical protein [Candidatus Scalindua sp.]